MKKTLLSIIVVSIFTLVGYGQKSTTVKLNANESTFEVKALKSNGFTIENSIATLNLNSIVSQDGNYTSLESEGLIKTFEEGMPNIPIITKLIEVPQGAEVALSVISFDEEIIKLSDYGFDGSIVPALRSQSKSEESVPFVKNQAIYNSDYYINDRIATYQESGQLRAARIGNLIINPIQYNPVQNTIRVLNNLVVEVNFVNADIEATKVLKRKYNTPFFSDITASSVINNVNGSKELITQAPTHMVIVSDRMFEAQLVPFVEWKIKKGFKITEAYTDVIGTTTTAIKTYLEGIYNGSDPMSFVLFVGDVQQIPAWNGNSGSHVTDLRYCEYTGDNLPEVYYGRFSAQNTSQLQPQIDKTLMYEQFTMADPSYLTEAFLVAGDDSSHEMTWGNGQIYYGDTNYFNASNNVNGHIYYQPLDNNAVHTIIINDMNAGLGFANYTAHCGPSGWSSPSFSTSDVYALTNDEKYGVWIGNCCLSVKFDDSECFGEAALRKANGGAIGDIGGSNSTYWDEDYWWGVGLTTSILAEPTYADSGRGAYDGVWHNLANETNDISTWYPTQGQIQVCGNIAVEASTSSLKEYYWEIYHLMGDPSVTNYIGTPQAMTVTPSPGTLLIGMTSLNVSSAPYAYVALSQGGVLVAAAMSDNAGNASLAFSSNALAVGDADLVVTCQNKIPYIGTIAVTPADEPYVVLNDCTTTTPPNFGETIGLNVTLENVAASGSGYDAVGVTATISTSDTNVTINDDTESYGTIIAGEMVSINDAFNITIAEDVPDQYVIPFDLHITDTNGYTWDTILNITANAPILTIGALSIDDTATGNGDSILDPGETADLKIQTTNEGHASVANVNSWINTWCPELIVNSANATVSELLASETKEFVFNVSTDSGLAEGTAFSFKNTVTAGSQNQFSLDKWFFLSLGENPQYCVSYATSTADSMIEEVQFGSVVNNTAGDGCSTYSDFTNDESLTDYFDAGNTYPISIYVGTCGGDYNKAGKVYIDWNYDGDFDDTDEMVFETAVGSSSFMAEGTFTVPTSTPNGQRYMRIVVSEDESNINPCGTYSYGETEDYKIYIGANLGVTENELMNVSLYPNPNNGTFTVDFRRLDTSNNIQVELFNINGQLIYQKNTSESIFSINTQETTGIYFLRLTSGGQVMNKKVIISNK